MSHPTHILYFRILLYFRGNYQSSFRNVHNFHYKERQREFSSLTLEKQVFKISRLGVVSLIKTIRRNYVYIHGG